MSWLSLVPVIGGIIDKIIPDKDAANKAKAALEMMAAQGELDIMLEQIKTNRQASQHSSIFVAGARPFIIWVCGSVFAYHYLLYPIIVTIASMHGLDVSHLPVFDLASIQYVLGGLLGLGGMRTFEKIKGVNR